MAASLRLSMASFRLVFRAPGVFALPLGTLVWTLLWVAGPVSFMLWLVDKHPEAARSFFEGLFVLAVQAWRDGEYGTAVALAVAEGYVLYAFWLTIVLTGVLYFMTVGMDVASQQIRQPGRTPSMGAAFGLANRNLGRLLLLALFNATVFAWVRYTIKFGVGLLTSPLRMVPVLGGMARRAITGGVSMVLTAVSYLMLPVVVYERAGPWNAMRSAWNNVKKTWAGLMVGTAFMWISLYVLFEVFAATVLHLMFEDPTVTLIVSIIAASVVYALATATASAMRATLYWYATTGEVPEGVRADDLPKVTPVGSITDPRQVPYVPIQPPGTPLRDPGQAPPARLRCPRCATVATVQAGARPSCARCGYGA